MQGSHKLDSAPLLTPPLSQENLDMLSVLL